MKDAFYLSLVQLFYDILTKTQKYIKPPPKLHDPDHAPNVADIVTRFIDLITKATQMQMLQSGREFITVNGNLHRFHPVSLSPRSQKDFLKFLECKGDQKGQDLNVYRL